MKKALVFVLVLGFIGTLAFAQNAPALKFNGYVNSGATLFSQGSNSSLIGLGSDSWVENGRYQLEGTYSADNWGLGFRLRSDGMTAAPVVKRAWGWFDLVNNMVKLKAGSLDSYDWASGGWQNFGNQDGALGIQVELMPVAGANLGLFLPTATVDTATLAANSSTAPLPVNALITNSLSNDFKALVLGAKYSMDKMGYVALGYDLGNKYFWAGASYTGMENLTAILEAKFNNTSNKANNYFYTDQQIGYKMAPYNFNLYAEEQFNSEASVLDGTTTVYHFQPSADYTMNNWNFGAFFSYIGEAGTTGGAQSGYGPGVWAKATIAKGATIALGGEYDLGKALPATSTMNQNTLVTGNYDPLGGPFIMPTGATAYSPFNGATMGLGPMSNNILRAYVDFVYSF